MLCSKYVVIVDFESDMLTHFVLVHVCNGRICMYICIVVQFRLQHYLSLDLQAGGKVTACTVMYMSGVVLPRTV